MICKQALEILWRLVAGGRGQLSAQILGEFFRAVTEKIRALLTAADAYA